MPNYYPIKDRNNVVLERKPTEVLSTCDRETWHDSYVMGNVTTRTDLINWLLPDGIADHTFTHKATLNLIPQCRHNQAANRAVGFFTKRFEREVFGANGVKRGVRLNWFPVLQMNELSGLHIHIAIGGIPDRLLAQPERLHCKFMNAAECWEFKWQNKHFATSPEALEWIRYITRWLDQDQICAEHIHFNHTRGSK